MNNDSQDNLIYLTAPPTAKAGDITSTRRPRWLRHIPQRKSWPTTNQSI